CAALCKGDGACNSFTYLPDVRSCEFKHDPRFAPGGYAGFVSGVRKEFRMRVQGVYVVPKGETARPGAAAAMEAALRVVQAHFAKELGRTFVIEAPAVTVISTDNPASFFEGGEPPAGAKQPDPEAPPPDWAITSFAKAQFGEDYILRKNLVVVVVEGLQGASYGGAGLAVISDFMWSPVYSAHKNQTNLLAAASFAGWSHEIAHALGLWHWDFVNACLASETPAVPPLGPIGAAVMWQQAPQQPSILDYYFADWEKKRLLGENRSEGRNCSVQYPATIDNLRPASEGYFQVRIR
ncbi:MAG: hypothetical protein ACRCTI_15585, partial [Beijerinckiaceae bacterium]